MKIEFAEPNETLLVFEMFSDFSGEELNKLGMEFDRQKLMSQVKDMIKKKSVLVGKDAFKIIGAVAGILWPCGFSSDVFFNASLFYIHPDSRHKTVAFIKELMEFLKCTPATQLVISNPAYSPDGLNRFYHMQGFQKLETHWIKKIEREAWPQM